MFALDVRSLAALRVALGILLIADIAWRLPLFGALYAIDSAWPLHFARTDTPLPWSPYFWVEQDAFSQSCMLLAAVAAVALTLGWKTRIATVMSWLLLVALQQRNSLVLNAGDSILRLTVFWAMFLPLGAYASLDSRRKSALPSVVVSPASAAWLLQVAQIYFFNALYKTGDAWEAGDATAKTFLLETYVTPFGEWLRVFPEFLRYTTHAVWWVELLLPLLLFLPWRTGLWRMLAVVVFVGFHIAILATLRIGLFPIICMAMWLALLPSGFWEKCTGKAAHFPLPQPRVLGILAASAACYVFSWNVWTFFQEKPPLWFRAPAFTLGLSQKWALFSPSPPAYEGWMLTVIEASDGIDYDAETGREVDWARPAHLGQPLPSAQWRKYLAALRDDSKPERAEAYLKWQRQRWDAANPERPATRIRLHYLWEHTARRENPPQHQLVLEIPPGPLTDEARRLGWKLRPAREQSDH